MRNGVVWLIVAFVFVLVGSFIPVLGLPLLFLGAVFGIIGWIKIFWGAGKKVVGATASGSKAVSNVAKAATKKGSGSGTL